jgi:hypothetical protein
MRRFAHEVTGGDFALAGSHRRIAISLLATLNSTSAFLHRGGLVWHRYVAKPDAFGNYSDASTSSASPSLDGAESANN